MPFQYALPTVRLSDTAGKFGTIDNVGNPFGVTNYSGDFATVLSSKPYTERLHVFLRPCREKKSRTLVIECDLVCSLYVCEPIARTNTQTISSSKQLLKPQEKVPAASRISQPIREWQHTSRNLSP